MSELRSPICLPGHSLVTASQFKRLLSWLAAPLLLLFSLPSTAFTTDDEQNTIEVFRASSPAVVYVTNQAVIRDRYTRNIQTVPQGTGTGVIWNRQGYIITNYHVIEHAKQITITLQDQSDWPAQVVGIAPSKDLAVLKINAPKKLLKALPLGDSSRLTVGNKVLAIGNPFGLDTTLTVGVVSALGREIDGSNRRTLRNLIQTDAAINPGNSGGPLINASGELIGINTAIYSPSGANSGIGFAIPINTIAKLVPKLIKNGRLSRPQLGIEIGPSHWAQRHGIKGVPVMRVNRGSPAERGNLRGIYQNRRGITVLGDVIIGLGGEVVEDYDDLLTALEEHQPGDAITVTVVRDGKIIKRNITLAPSRR